MTKAALCIFYPQQQQQPLTTITRQDAIKWLMRLVSALAWSNAVAGLVNLSLYMLVGAEDGDLIITGALCLCMFQLSRVKTRYVMHCKNWIEIVITVVCGVYLPAMALWLMVTSLLNALQ